MPIKKYFLTGLLAWLPLAVTVWLLLWLFGMLEGISGALLTGLGAVLPEAASDFLHEIRDTPGVGALILLLVIFLTGALVSNYVGRWLMRKGDQVMSSIPGVKAIYSSVKKVSQTLFANDGQAFRKAVLVQYPRHGAWTVAFLTGEPVGEVAAHLSHANGGADFLSVYVPTTPNPTSGFFLMMPRSEITELDMTVDEALTYIISMGTVAPNAAAPQIKV